MNVYIGGTKSYSAMQGPCDSGFHIPTSTEWVNIYNIWTSLGGGSSDGNNLGICLKLPYTGFRSTSNGSAYDHGSSGYYWASDFKKNFNFTSSSIRYDYSSSISFGFSIRAFKDVPVVPNSSWEKLYGTSIEAGGIFWSSTDGLISLSSDGTNWITMSDKNLGATQVWNNGDTLSETNCGKSYQQGNNYGFPFTGSVTTSSTQVDASSYGPGNYYSDSTFITGDDWSSVQNDNLRGGVTGVVSPAELKNAYIGEYIPLIQNASLLGNTNTKQDVQGVRFSPDGTKMIVGFWNISNVTEYTLSTPFNPSTKTEIRTLSGTYQNSGMWFNHDGTIMILSTRINSSPYPTNVQKYTLSAPFALNTATLVQSYNAGNGKFTSGVCLSDDGKKIYINIDGEGIYQGTMSTAFDLNTISLSSGTFQSGGRGIALRGNGKILYTSNSNSVGDYGLISQYKLDTPYDILGSKTLLSTFNAGGGEGAALWVSEDMGYFSWCLGGNKSQDVRIFKTN